MWQTILWQRDATSAVDIITDNRIARGGNVPIMCRRTYTEELYSALNLHKCINCMTYNQYSKKEKICENHPSLSKNCPSLHVVLTKYRQNTDY
jgi:hypothetical protein